jgi:hypothetical protein
MFSWRRVASARTEKSLTKYLLVLAVIGNVACICWVLLIRMPSIALWPEGFVIASASVGIFNCVKLFQRF